MDAKVFAVLFLSVIFDQNVSQTFHKDLRKSEKGIIRLL